MHTQKLEQLKKEIKELQEGTKEKQSSANHLKRVFEVRTHSCVSSSF